MPVLPVSPSGRRYGRFRDNPYHPARKLLTMKVSDDVVLPPKASTSEFMGPIRDQGQEGSCTGQMGAEIRDMLFRKFWDNEKDKSISADQFMASAEFVYLCNLIADGDLGQDAGSSIHQTIITLNQKGACPDSYMHYSDKEYSVAPTEQQYETGALFKAGAYHYLPDLKTMKACIASGYSFGGGIEVYSSFEGEWRERGFMPMPNTANEDLLGGHAQHFMDYDDTLEFPDGTKGGFLVQNSWGSGWGISAPSRSDGGCYWMPYEYAQDPTLLSDTWVIHLGPAWK